MTIQFFQIFQPQWQFFDDSGLPASGGTVESYESQDHDQLKPLYRDPEGTPWTDPIELDASGKVPGLVYGADDEPYYIIVKDINGNIIFQQDGLIPINPNPPIIPDIDIQNYINNGQFFYYNYPIIKQIAPDSKILIAPDNHFFYKNNDTATDFYQFSIIPAGTTNPPGNPLAWFNYVCTSGGSAESSKYYAYKFDAVRNFAGESINISLVAVSDTSSSVTLTMVQNFGTNGSTQIETAIQALNLTPGATQYPIVVNVPSIAGKIVNQNDSFFEIRLNYPLNTTCNVKHTNMSLRFGSEIINYQEESITRTSDQVVSSQIPVVQPIQDYPYRYLTTNSSVTGYQQMGRTGETVLWPLSIFPEHLYPLDGAFIWHSDCPSLGDWSAAANWYYGYGEDNFNYSIATTVITFTAFKNGAILASPNMGTTPFTFSVTQPGDGGTPAIIALTCANINTVINGNYFYLSSSTTKFQVYFNIDNQFGFIPDNDVHAVEVRISSYDSDTAKILAVAMAIKKAQFRLQDLRGWGLRFVDNGAGNDPGADDRLSAAFSNVPAGDNVGTTQLDAVQNHTHSLPETLPQTGGDNPTQCVTNINLGATNTGNMSSGRASTETRMKNVSIWACIHK